MHESSPNELADGSGRERRPGLERIAQNELKLHVEQRIARQAGERALRVDRRADRARPVASRLSVKASSLTLDPQVDARSDVRALKACERKCFNAHNMGKAPALSRVFHGCFPSRSRACYRRRGRTFPETFHASRRRLYIVGSRACDRSPHQSRLRALYRQIPPGRPWRLFDGVGFDGQRLRDRDRNFVHRFLVELIPVVIVYHSQKRL